MFANDLTASKGQVQTTPKHGTMQRMNELTNQIERLQGRVHETMVRL